jgi:hypothetical protein
MRRPRRRKRDVLGWALIAIVFAALIALGAAGFALRPPPTDPDTLCRTDKPVLAHTIILIDATDTLEPRHRKRLRAAIDTERARLAPYDRLTILRIRPDAPSEPRVLFSKCLPRDGAHSNPLFENPKLAQQRWDEAVGVSLKSAESRAGAGRGASASPIVQSVFATAADPDFAPRVPKRRLVLISDLLEYTPGGFSLYREDADFAAYKAARGAAPAAPDLEGVSVRIVTLDRDDQAQRQALARTRFWAPFFEAAGVDGVDWDPSP